MNEQPKILVLDIETKPTVAYVWRLFKENIGLNQILEPGGMICFSAKWFGSRDIEFYSEWEHGHEEMVRQAHRLLSEADAVVTYNGDKFDLPKLNGEFLLAGLPPVPPLASIDVYKTVRHKLGFLNNRLAFVGPLLQVGAKVKHAGFELWAKVDRGDPVAQRKMERYCKQDVRLLERVYRKIRPFVTNHPHMGHTPHKACGACGSHHVHVSKWRRTRTMRIQQLHCQSCGSYFDGIRQKVT